MQLVLHRRFFPLSAVFVHPVLKVPVRASESNTAAFEKVGECLYRYIPTGTYYARIKRPGKEVRHSLDTADRATAKRKLADLHREVDLTKAKTAWVPHGHRSSSCDSIRSWSANAGCQVRPPASALATCHDGKQRIAPTVGWRTIQYLRRRPQAAACGTKELGNELATTRIV